MITLVPLDADGFTEFIEQAMAEYAAEHVAIGRLKPEEAPAQVRRETAQLLPQGIATPGHSFYVLSAAGEAAGYLWLASQERGSLKVAYVYQIVVKPLHRRRGYAREALRQAEVLAREQGHEVMALNVFAHNEGAQALYRSLGYAVTNLNMAKSLRIG
jgi:ribosomal protein S18 acetylase RimI-like enzyme